MLRRLLLAALLCLSVWALADRVVHVSDPVLVPVTGTAAGSSAPDDAGGPDARWDAPPPFHVGVTGSSWSSQLQIQSVDLPGISRRDDAGRTAPSWPATRRPAPSGSPHLHDIPLLI